MNTIALLTRTLTTWAHAGRPVGGDYEYHLYAIGTGYLR